MTNTEVELLDNIDEQFVCDDDVQMALSHYARKTITKAELADRLEFLLTQAERNAEKIVFGREVNDGGFENDHPDDVSCFSRRGA